MFQFEVGGKVILLSDHTSHKTGTICEVASLDHMPEYLGIRYPGQENGHFPFQNPKNFVLVDVYESPLFQALL